MHRRTREWPTFSDYRDPPTLFPPATTPQPPPQPTATIEFKTKQSTPKLPTPIQMSVPPKEKAEKTRKEKRISGQRKFRLLRTENWFKNCSTWPAFHRRYWNTSQILSEQPGRYSELHMAKQLLKVHAGCFFFVKAFKNRFPRGKMFFCQVSRFQS